MPAGQKWPPGQGWHDVEPVAEVKVPAEQFVQLVAPELEKVPLGQSEALMELKEQKEPAGQRTGTPEKQ